MAQLYGALLETILPTMAQHLPEIAVDTGEFLLDVHDLQGDFIEPAPLQPGHQPVQVYPDFVQVHTYSLKPRKLNVKTV